MKKNVRIAKQLLKIAKSLVSDNTRTAAGHDITDGLIGYRDQLDILRQFPTTLKGDTDIHRVINEKFKQLLTITNGTSQAWEAWVADCNESVQDIVQKANRSIATTGELGLTDAEKDELQIALAYRANEKFLVTLTPGEFKKNLLQQKPGAAYDELQPDGTYKERLVPNVPDIGIDKSTQTIMLDKKHPNNPANAASLLQIPTRILRLHGNLVSITTSWGNRIISGTQLGTIDLGDTLHDVTPAMQEEQDALANSWMEISDTEINAMNMQILARLSTGNAEAVYKQFVDIFKNLVDQLGMNDKISAQTQQEFLKHQKNIDIAIQNAERKTMFFLRTYRDGIRNVLNEYNSFCDIVTTQGGKVDKRGNIILPNGKQASMKIRNAGLLDKLKEFGNKVVDSVSSFFKKIFGKEDEVKEEIEKCNKAALEWSLAGQEITEGYKSDMEAINTCLKQLKQLAQQG